MMGQKEEKKKKKKEEKEEKKEEKEENCCGRDGTDGIKGSIKRSSRTKKNVFAQSFLPIACCFCHGIKTKAVFCTWLCNCSASLDICQTQAQTYHRFHINENAQFI